MEKYIKGQFRSSIFESDNNYIIGLFRVKETNDEELNDYINKTITFTGYFSDLQENDSYTMYGELVNHPKYGLQYNVSNYEHVKPEERDGLIMFLCSPLFPGIGEATAKSIVDTLGDTTLDQILADKSCLNLVPGLTSKRMDIIYDKLVEYEESHTTIVYLTNLGFSMKDALSIYKTYQGNTISTLEHNIYQIIDDIEDISFLNIDRLASKYGIEPHDERRVIACIFYTMQRLIFETGSTYLELEEIKYEVEKFLNFSITTDSFSSYIEELELSLKIVVDDNKYYLFDMYEAEEFIVNKLKYLQTKSNKSYKNIQSLIEKMESELDIIYNEDQKEAITAALEKNLVIITGGPGTGKTTIIKTIIELYKQLNKLSGEQVLSNIALLAPTGRASKRMSEATSLPASTIHRFLKWNKDTDQYTVNEYNRDTSKLIIIDEVSMVDIMLMNHLLKGTLDDIKLVLVGDYFQLPSVGPGQFLKDIIETEVINTVKLNYLYRQEEDSYIPLLAEEMKNNNLSEHLLETHPDYRFLECHSSLIVESLKNIAEKFVEKEYDYRQFQIMAPMYRGVNGIDNLNSELQKVFNSESPLKNEVKYGDVIYRVGDKVLQLVNMPDENVYNGDVGIIIDIRKTGKKEIIIDFDGNEVTYTPKDFNKIKHGFITSIHKSQGNEFEIVVMVVSHSYGRMLYRKLLYTGVTRAKRKLFLVGEVSAFKMGVQNENEQVRKTDFKNKLLYSFD